MAYSSEHGSVNMANNLQGLTFKTIPDYYENLVILVYLIWSFILRGGYKAWYTSPSLDVISALIYIYIYISVVFFYTRYLF
ncbi:hypothetical protein FKM82_010157 [Ascaphus truei]